MNRSERLKTKRVEDGLSQAALAKKLGMSPNTINYLETDETRWGTMYTKTVDKINRYLDGTIEEMVTIIPAKRTSDYIDSERIDEQPVMVICKSKDNDDLLTENDKKTLTLIEFTYEGLSDSKTHEDFVANVNMIKRILKKY